MNLRPTQYHATHDGYDVKFNYIQRSNTWTAIRWQSGEVNIPTRADVLTENGWEPVLRVTAKSHHFDSLESVISSVEKAVEFNRTEESEPCL